jgi:hypothetical protein
MLAAQKTGLPVDSIANVSQVGSIDRSQLLRFLGTSPPSPMTRIDSGLRLVLDLSKTCAELAQSPHCHRWTPVQSHRRTALAE